MSSLINMSLEDVLSEMAQQEFVSNLRDAGVSSTVLVQSLPKSVVEGLCGGISIESIQAPTADKCITSLINADLYPVASESFMSEFTTDSEDSYSVESLSEKMAGKFNSNITSLKDSLQKAKEYAKENPYKVIGGCIAIIALAAASVVLYKFITKRHTSLRDAKTAYDAAIKEYNAAYTEDIKQYGFWTASPDGSKFKPGMSGEHSWVDKNVHVPNYSYHIKDIYNPERVVREEAYRKARFAEEAAKKVWFKNHTKDVDAAYKKAMEVTKAAKDAIDEVPKMISTEPNGPEFYIKDIPHTVKWDYTAVGKKISEAEAAIKKLEDVVGGMKEFVTTLNKAFISPKSISEVSDFFSKKAVAIWVISMYGLIILFLSKCIAVVKTKISTSAHIGDKE